MFLTFLISLFILLSCFFAPANERQPDIAKKGTEESIQLDAIQAELNEKLIEAASRYPPEDAVINPRAAYTVEAIKNRAVREVSELLAEGANPNARDESSGRTPLHRWYYTEVAELLVRAGADLNAQDDQGNTPLHYFNLSGNHGNFSKVKFLVENGADFNIANNKGEIPRATKRYPELLDISPKPKQATSCSYFTEWYRQINAIQCGRNSICIAKVFCVFEVGMDPNKIQIARNFQIVCPSLSNGQCPKADDCVFDRSVSETPRSTWEAPVETQSPSSSSSRRSRRGTR